MLDVGRHAERDNFTSIWPKRAGGTPTRANQKQDQIKKTLSQIHPEVKEKRHKPLNLRPFT
jgi:hypothetical protein